MEITSLILINSRMTNFLVWTIDNNSIWDALTILFLLVVVRPLWLVSNNNRTALFIVTSKAYGELFSITLILICELVPPLEFALPYVVKYCHTIVYMHVFALALNRAHLVLAPMHYFERVKKGFILCFCAVCHVVPALICYPSVYYPNVWKFFIDAGLWMSLGIYACIIGRFVRQKSHNRYEQSLEKDNAKIFACCLFMLLPLMCSHYTSAALARLFSGDENVDQITLNQVLLFALNVSNNLSTISDEICLLVLCRELRTKTADQFRTLLATIMCQKRLLVNNGNANGNNNVSPVDSNLMQLSPRARIVVTRSTRELLSPATAVQQQAPFK